MPSLGSLTSDLNGFLLVEGSTTGEAPARSMSSLPLNLSRLSAVLVDVQVVFGALDDKNNVPSGLLGPQASHRRYPSGGLFWILWL